VKPCLLEAAQILEDIADVADIMGRASEQRIGAVYIDREHGEHLRRVANELRETLEKLWCQKVEFGSYTCYEDTQYGFAVDSCLVYEVNELNSDGIKTIGCCCGHGRQQGYIQVAPESVGEMLNMGYERLPIDEHGNGQWCFIPKTPFWLGQQNGLFERGQGDD
jgi:hypothetical protein